MAGISYQIEFDPNQEFYYKIIGFEHLVRNANYYAAAQIERGLASIILGAFENAVRESDFPAEYAAHLERGMLTMIVSGAQAQATDGGLIAVVPDMQILGTWEDLIRGMHYHALAAKPATDGRKFSKTVVNRIELPYTGQEMYNQNRPERRQGFWEAIVSGTVYTVNVTRRNRGKGGGTNSYKFDVPTAGLYNETLMARVATWGLRYPEWLLLEYGSGGPPQIQPTHLRTIIQQNVLAFMQEAWLIQFNSLVEQWDRDQEASRAQARISAREDAEWERFYSHHIDEAIDRYDYGYDQRGRGSQIRNLKTGRFA